MSLALPRPASWKRALTSDISLVTSTVVVTNVLRIFSTVLLTRLLAPADFGVVGITAALLIVMSMISDVGFNVFVVQHRDGDDPHFLDTVWTVRLIRSAMLTVVLFVLAAPFANLIDKPTMHWAIAATSLHFVIEGLSSLSSMTAVRERNLMRISILDVSITGLQIAISVAIAAVIHSYWAIIFAGVIAAAVKTVLTYTMFENSKRRFAVDMRYVRELWSFGRPIVGANTIQVLLSQMDKFVLSRLFSLNLFGLYSISSNLAQAPSAFTALYPHRILLPEYAAIQRERPEELAHTYYASRRTVMLLFMLAMGGFIGMAPAVVDILYEPRYAQAADYLRILAISPLISLNNYAAREVLVVVNRVKALFYANVVRLAWLVAAGPAGFLLYGPLGLIVAVGTIELPVLFYNFWELHREKLFRLREELLIVAAAAIGLGLGLLADGLFFRLFH